MQDLTIGIVQTQQFWENKDANLQNFERIFDANFEGKDIDLILLPEMFNTGFSMRASDLAETMEGDSIKWLIKWAGKLNCQLAASLIISDKDKYYNRMIVASANSVETYYDKRHLFRMADEHNHYTAGEKRVVHQLKGWNILLQICYDLRFPVFSRNKVIDGKKEYDLCIYVANWPEKRVYAWRNLLQARAIENQAYCVGVNRTGTDGNEIPYSGDSMVIDPWGSVVLDCSSSTESVHVFTLKRSVLDEITEKFPAFLDADV